MSQAISPDDVVSIDPAPPSHVSPQANNGDWFANNAPSKSIQNVSTKTLPKAVSRNTKEAPQTISASKPKSFLERITDPFIGEGSTYGTLHAQQTGHKWAAGQDAFSKPLVDINAVRAEDAATNPVIRGAIKGVEQTATDFTTPRSVELFAATGGLWKTPIIGKLVSAGFGLDQIKSAVQRSPELKKKLAAGDSEGAAKVMTEMGLGVEMGRRAVNHAGSKAETASRKPENKPSEPPPPPPSTPPIPAPPPETIRTIELPPQYSHESTPPLWDKAKQQNQPQSYGANGLSRKDYFTPGNIVKSYSGQDKVLDYKESPDGTWKVKVQAVDKQGNDLSHEKPRWHATPPEEGEQLIKQVAPAKTIKSDEPKSGGTSGEEYRPYSYPAPDPEIHKKYEQLGFDNPVTLTSKQHTAVSDYAGSGYHLINDYLRKGNTGDYNKSHIEGRIADIRSSMKPLNSDVVVWRGVAIDPPSVGSMVHDKGFGSTSLDPETAYHWISQTHKTDRPVIFRIEVPKGTDALIMGNAGHGGEREVLLPPGVKGKVISSHIVKEKDGKTIVLVNVKVDKST